MLFDLKEKYPAYYRYYGRRIAKRLSPSLSKIFEEEYINYSIDKEILNVTTKQDSGKTYILNPNYKKHTIEIGFGDGEHLISKAKNDESTHYIGCEVFINGLGKVLKRIKEENIYNISLCGLNCLYLLNSLENRSIDDIFIINPDPWEKKRHFKRRLINHDFISLLYKKLKINGSVSITTDSISYFEHMSEIIKNNDIEFKYCDIKALNSDDYLFNISKYQKKGILKGRKIHLIHLKRL